MNETEVSAEQKRKAKRTIFILAAVVILIYAGYFYLQATR